MASSGSRPVSWTEDEPCPIRDFSERDKEGATDHGFTITACYASLAAATNGKVLAKKECSLGDTA